MKKMLFVLLLVLPCIAFADDVSVGVVDRINCSDVQKQIDKLSALETLTDEENEELVSLKNTQREKCTQKVPGARVGTVRGSGLASKNAPVPVEAVDDEDSVNCKSLEEEIEKLQAQYNKMCAVNVAQEKPSAEEVKKLRANGLCPDESKPNKFGCCDGETFKEVGDMEFKCCPDDGGECLPLVVRIKQ